MKRLLVLSLALIAGCSGGVVVKSEPTGAKVYAPTAGSICLLAGDVPADIKYERLGRIVATKRSYGSSDELLPGMATEAKKLGADAVIGLQANQRFKGPIPWRLMSPTGDGTAIKVLPDSPAIDCQKAGGRLF